MESRTRWKCRGILRAEAGLLPDYRGTASTLWCGAREAFRYKLRHPLRTVALFAMPVHPSSYHLISKYFWMCYPYPFRHIPERRRRLLLELAQASEAEMVDAADPLVRHVGWITRDSDVDQKFWRDAPFEDVQYYLLRNPGYGQGHGLALIAPLSFTNLVFSFIPYAFHLLSRWWGGRGAKN